MKKEKSIKVNFIFNTLLNMSNVIFPLISYPYVSRMLGPDGLGKVALAISIVGYAAMVAQLGIPTYGIRATARVRDDKVALSKVTHELVNISLVMSVVAYLILGICIASIPRLREVKLLYIIVSSSILFGAIGLEWLYRGLEEYSYITIRSLIFKALACILMFLLIRSESDYVWYGLLSIFASSASSVLNLINARKYVYLKPVKYWGQGITLEYKPHLQSVIVFMAMTCATTVYTNLDTVMLGAMSSDTEVGLYSVAVKLKGILIGIVTALSTVIMPRASYYIKKNKMDEFWDIGKNAMKYVILFACPVMTYMIVCAKECIMVVSGAGFDGAIMPMQVISPTILLIGITNIIGIQIMVPMGREKTVLLSVVCGAVTDCILNALLIPKYYSTGAAIGTLVAEAVVLIVQLVALKKDELIKLFNFPLLKLFISVICSTLVSIMTVKCSNYVVSDNSVISCIVRLLIVGMVFMVVYVGFLFFFKVVSIDEIKEILGRRKENPES